MINGTWKLGHDGIQDGTHRDTFGILEYFRRDTCQKIGVLTIASAQGFVPMHSLCHPEGDSGLHQFYINARLYKATAFSSGSDIDRFC